MVWMNPCEVSIASAFGTWHSPKQTNKKHAENIIEEGTEGGNLLQTSAVEQLSSSSDRDEEKEQKYERFDPKDTFQGRWELTEKMKPLLTPFRIEPLPLLARRNIALLHRQRRLALVSYCDSQDSLCLKKLCLKLNRP